jgi:hypothetical protein
MRSAKRRHRVDGVMTFVATPSLLDRLRSILPSFIDVSVRATVGLDTPPCTLVQLAEQDRVDLPGMAAKAFIASREAFRVIRAPCKIEGGGVA